MAVLPAFPLGALQVFQNNGITQSCLLSYIDICFGMATLGVIALISAAVTRTKPKFGQHPLSPVVSNKRSH
jgi:hypothetical protein